MRSTWARCHAYARRALARTGDKKGKLPDGVKLIAKNRKASFEYHIDEDIEAGLVLTGTEVKSLREGKVQLVDAYAAIQGREAFVYQMHIAEYPNGTIYNHEPRRVRKLLLHRSELERLVRKVREKGITLIPLEIYFKNGRAKLRLGLCRGKKQHDKRHSIKQRDLDRDLVQRGAE